MKDGKKRDTININGTNVSNHVGCIKYTNNDWGTLAFLIPRNEVRSAYVEEELRFNSIYMLVQLGGGTERVYIGQSKKRNTGESVLARLREHDNAYENWDWAVVFTGKSDTWLAEDLNALEKAIFISLDSKNRININCPSYGGSYDTYDDKIRQIKNYVTAIGFNLFDDTVDTEKIQITQELPERLNNGMSWITEVITPSKVVKQMCDMLPTEVWNENTVFLDMACNGGEYLREIFDRLMETESLISMYPDDIERALHILEKQLYGIALSSVSFERTTKKLMGFSRNIKHIEHFIELLKGYSYEFNADGTYKKIDDVLREEFGADMKVDVVIGNPPYQEVTQSIYPLFINKALDISSRHVEMVVKDNWLTSNTLENVRFRMLRNGLKRVIEYPLVGEVFSGIGVAVNIFHVDKKYTGKTLVDEVKQGKIQNSFEYDFRGLPLISVNQTEIEIMNKVRRFNEASFESCVHPVECFRITSNLCVGRGERSYGLDYRVQRDDEYNIGVLYRIGNIEMYAYTKEENVPARKDIITHYKLLSSSAINNNGTVVSGIERVNCNTICSSSYTVLYSDEDESKVFGAYTYVRTKFFRFLLRILCDRGKCMISPYRFRLIPMQDFRKTWTDAKLYRKYSLSSAEIDYIENTMKEIDYLE